MLYANFVLLTPTADCSASAPPTDAAISTATAAPTVEKSAPELVQRAGPMPGGTLPVSSIDKTEGGARLGHLCPGVPPSRRRCRGLGCRHAGDARRPHEGAGAVLTSGRPHRGPEPRGARCGLHRLGCLVRGGCAASCMLADVNYLERPLLIPKEELLPRPPPEAKLEDLIIMAQVRSIASRSPHPIQQLGRRVRLIAGSGGEIVFRC